MIVKKGKNMGEGEAAFMSRSKRHDLLGACYCLWGIAPHYCQCRQPPIAPTVLLRAPFVVLPHQPAPKNQYEVKPGRRRRKRYDGDDDVTVCRCANNASCRK
jgi:hypothetical protein